MPDETSQPPAGSKPFTRGSTVLELSSTLPGRAFKALVLRKLPKANSEKERQELEELTVGLPLETLVEMSEGKLTWGVVDSVIDLANKKPQRVATRTAGAGYKAASAGYKAASRRVGRRP